MGKSKKYRISIEDEAHLQTIGSVSMSVPSICIACVIALLAAVAAGGFLVMVTPLKTLLPGYLKKSERNASVENLMRLDSLQAAYVRNQEYIDNFIRVADPSFTPDSAREDISFNDDISPDSLIPASQAEKVFVKSMQEREKYNLSVLTPLAADGMMFGVPAHRAVFLRDSRAERKCAIAIDKDEPVTSIADGTVLAAYYSPSEKGYVVITQHARGFVSRLSHLYSPVVETGDAVGIGQVVSLPSRNNAPGGNTIYIEMWHNAISLRPYDFLSNDLSYSLDANYDTTE